MKISEATHIAINTNGSINLFAGEPEWDDTNDQYFPKRGTDCYAIYHLGETGITLDKEQAKASLKAFNSKLLTYFDAEESDED